MIKRKLMEIQTECEIFFIFLHCACEDKCPKDIFLDGLIISQAIEKKRS